ncbi:prolyl oligopeptidase family serine peptidase [Chloroflexi bacterium TSY]|nr:prolyl oligopeptidase family serine peptidase [Chloroflexi bacterium TSY]
MTRQNQTHSLYRIESLLAARLFLQPKLVDERIYFISDLSGRMSLYVMDETGSVPEPLLPPSIALQNPELIGGESYVVMPNLGKVLVMIDQDGDENYQPMLIPLDGGVPKALFGDQFAGQQLTCARCDAERNQAIFMVDPRDEAILKTILVHLDTCTIIELGSTPYMRGPIAVNEDWSRIVLNEIYTRGDVVLYMWESEKPQLRLLYGTPLSERESGIDVPLNGIGRGTFVSDDGLLFRTSLFTPTYGLGYFNVANADPVEPVEISGIHHSGYGEFEGIKEIAPGRYNISYNIDGCSWVYEGSFDEKNLRFTITKVLCGAGTLAEGVLAALDFDKTSDRYTAAFSTATAPSQLYLIANGTPTPRTNERILGIPQQMLASGEDTSYPSHDGLRISARLYLPTSDLGFEGPRPVVFYIHGGPQSQERPDFTWFSMPLIQFFTLTGIAVFVPNVRGSSGYGIEYMKHVDRDWGGNDRLDHLAAFDHLRADPRLDMDRIGVMGRSYGGYMTLTLAARHPELWKAACDMFGPYSLFSFLERLPPAWRTYFEMSMGHPEKDKEMLTERSPHTWLHQLACPMLVIQGANDPRVVESESSDLVENLRSQGKEIEYLVFEDEGHDVIKYHNKVRCYNQIVDFFARHLQP